MMRRIKRENSGGLRPGQDLVAAGFAGQAGCAAIAEAERQRLLTWFSAEYLDSIEPAEDRNTAKERRSLGFWAGFGATEWEPAGEGGILAAIWNLSGAYETGVAFSLRRIPVRQETIEICERFELNPYRLYSAGCCLLTAENGGQMVEALAARQIPAQVIGRVNRGISREMKVQDDWGFLERPQPDEIYKVIPDFQMTQPEAE